MVVGPLEVGLDILAPLRKVLGDPITREVERCRAPPWRRAQPITRDAILRRRGAELEEFLVGDDVLFVVVVGFGVELLPCSPHVVPSDVILIHFRLLPKTFEANSAVGVSSAQEYPVLKHA